MSLFVELSSVTPPRGPSSREVDLHLQPSGLQASPGVSYPQSSAQRLLIPFFIENVSVRKTLPIIFGLGPSAVPNLRRWRSPAYEFRFWDKTNKKNLKSTMQSNEKMHAASLAPKLTKRRPYWMLLPLSQIVRLFISQIICMLMHSKIYKYS